MQMSAEKKRLSTVPEHGDEERHSMSSWVQDGNFNTDLTMKKVFNSNFQAGSKKTDEPRLIGDILAEMFSSNKCLGEEAGWQAEKENTRD